MEQSIVYVLGASGKPLMPTRRRNKVWYWLRCGLAKVVSREPFTIQLRFETTEYTQPVTIGVDTGSKTVGLAATTNGAVVYQAEAHLRADITDKLAQRKKYRRARRFRNTRYRAARFANRRRPAGWMPPSLRSKAEATVKAVHFVARVLPVCQINVEVGRFDTQKMQHPEISGLDYQQGELQGYLLREYLLEKWQRHCAYCGAEEVPLEVEHIVPRSRGGSNRVSNLTLACQPCNVRKGKQTAAEFGYPTIQAQARTPLKDAAHVSTLKTAVVQRLRAIFGTDQVAVSYGYETKYKRTRVLGLPKSHTNDAVAIACVMGEVVEPCTVAHVLRCVPRGKYQLFNGKHSEHRIWAPRKVKGWKLYERVAAKGQVGYIGGRRLKGSFVLKDLSTGKTILEVVPSKLQRLARCTHGWIAATMEFNEKEGGASSQGL
jgi:5-methylcytosine-specific restriction endonuclease McrA